jgi:predicted glutamine amidotransferase
MNDLEFQIQYKRLKECHPFIYGSKEKMETIWKFVHDMDEPWFRKMVDNICAVSDARHEKYDIG